MSALPPLTLPTRGPWSWTCLHELRRDGGAVELVLETTRFRRLAIALPLTVGLGFAVVLQAVPDEPSGFRDAVVVAVALAVVAAMLLALWKHRSVEARRGPAVRVEPDGGVTLPRAGRTLERADLAGLVLLDGPVDLHGDTERAFVLSLLVHADEGRVERHDLSRGLDGKGLTRLGEELAAALGLGLERRSL